MMLARREPSHNGGAPVDARLLQQAHQLLEQVEEGTESLARAWAELRERERLARERQQDANTALAIGSIGCMALAVAIFAGGWWAAGLELGIIAWLLLELRRREAGGPKHGG